MSDIELRLSTAHKIMESAGLSIITMLVKRRLWKGELKDAVSKLRRAADELEKLLCST